MKEKIKITDNGRRIDDLFWNAKQAKIASIDVYRTSRLFKAHQFIIVLPLAIWPGYHWTEFKAGNLKNCLKLGAAMLYLQMVDLLILGDVDDAKVSVQTDGM